MKVIMAPADDHGCGFYRMRAPAAALEGEANIDIEFSEGFKARRGVQTGRIIGLEEPVSADVVVLQRPLRRYLVETIPHLQKAGAAVVVDIDDDFSCLHAQHPTFQAVHPKLRPDHNWHHLKHACAIADLVTCSTKALAERFGVRNNAVVLPNCVPASYLEVPTPPKDGPVIGWAGFTHSHPRDLTVTRGGVREALERIPDSMFLTIGDGEGVADDLDLHGGLSRDKFDITGPVPLDEYPHALARLDVGIVPLLDSRFNAAKSWLKGLEYASVGVPFVASFTPEYERLSGEHIGLLAKDRSRDWRTMIDIAYRHRHELGQSFRAQVEDHWTYERNGWRWADAWALAMHRRAGTDPLLV